MKTKKLISVILVALVLVCMLCGCDKKIQITTGLKDDEIFKLSGRPCKMSEILLVLMNEKNRYEKDLGTDIWTFQGSAEGRSFEDEIKLKVKQQLAELKTIELLADKEEIQLSNDEKNMLGNAAEEYYNSLSKETIELLKVTKDDVASLYTSFYKADKVYQKLTEDISIEVSDEEARVMQCKYILVATSVIDEKGNKVSISEQEIPAKKDIASKAYEEVAAGNDFNTIAKKYSDSEEIDVNVTRQSIQSDIEASVYQLKSGEYSNIIETEDGYYVFFCVSDYLERETMDNKSQMKEKHKKLEYEKIYLPFEADQTFEFSDKKWNNIKLKDYSSVTTTNLYEVYNNWVASK